MPKFEVHIPANDQKSFSFTFRVDADGWTAALKAGMARLGAPGSTPGQNMLVDVQDDNSLHVTDAESGRVFQIRELSEVEASTAVIKKRVPSSNPSLAPAPAPAPASAPTLSDQPGFNPSAATIIESRDALPEHIRRELEGLPPKPVPSAAGRDDDDDEDTDPGLRARTVQEQEAIPTRRTQVPVTQPPRDKRDDATRVARTKGTSRPGAPAVPSRPGSSSGSGSRRAVPSSNPGLAREPLSKRGATPRGTGELEVVELERPVRPITGTIGRVRTGENQDIESMLSEVFERVQEMYNQPDPTQALYFLLDLAMEKVPVDAGSVLEVDAAGDLRFSAARGPKAAELLEANLVVPSGSGIAGFCAHEGVTLALSDVQKDPRFYGEVGRRVDYATRSVLTSPMMTQDRTFGCMQLLNKKGSPVFDAHEVGILSYIAHQAAKYLNALS
ncbi:MAG TPA: GAF domain-containing protein [Myxococcaceae bacterium]|jgi:hypothetical protein